MRNTRRIKDMMFMLETIWTRSPDLRLCQLVYNLTKGHDLDIYSCEDNYLSECMEVVLLHGFEELYKRENK